MIKKETALHWVRIFGCIYLVWIAISLFIRADESENPGFGLICAVVFIVVSVMVLWIEWRNWRRSKVAKCETTPNTLFDSIDKGDVEGERL